MKCPFRSLSLVSLFCSSCFAAQIQTMDTNKRLELKLGGKEINRLTVQGDRVSEWVCNDAHLSHEMDETNGHIFLRPLVSKGKIYGTLTTERGSVQDLALTIHSGPPETLVLIPHDQTETGAKTSPEGVSSSSHESLSKTASLEMMRGQAISLIKRLMAGEGEKGEGRRVGLKDPRKVSPSSLKCLRRLKDQGLEASLYEASEGLKGSPDTSSLNLWKQEGDVALGQYKGHLLVVRRAP